MKGHAAGCWEQPTPDEPAEALFAGGAGRCLRLHVVPAVSNLIPPSRPAMIVQGAGHSAGHPHQLWLQLPCVAGTAHHHRIVWAGRWAVCGSMGVQGHERVGRGEACMGWGAVVGVCAWRLLGMRVHQTVTCTG